MLAAASASLQPPGHAYTLAKVRERCFVELASSSSLILGMCTGQGFSVNAWPASVWQLGMQKPMRPGYVCDISITWAPTPAAASGLRLA